MWVLSLGPENSLEEGLAPTPVFLPGESYGQRSLAGYSPQDHKELDTNEVTQHAIKDLLNSIGKSILCNGLYGKIIFKTVNICICVCPLSAVGSVSVSQSEGPQLEPQRGQIIHSLCFSGGSADKGSFCSAGDLDSISGLGRSPGEGNSYPLQYAGLQNSMDHIDCEITMSRTQLSDFHVHMYVGLP